MPSHLGMDVNELIANLRQELEDKYSKQIQELKIIIANLNGTPTPQDDDGRQPSGKLLKV